MLGETQTLGGLGFKAARIGGRHVMSVRLKRGMFKAARIGGRHVMSSADCSRLEHATFESHQNKQVSSQRTVTTAANDNSHRQNIQCNAALIAFNAQFRLLLPGSPV